LIGIVVCMTASLGLITPPFGLCLLLATKIGEIPIIPAIKAVLPFIALFMLVVFLVILFPSIATFLPGLLTS
ncbi:MAG: TRAP transporter large permease subunit, partial [Spirochaetaceae bacterium]|nr:TRAP transporter large permease subunit [Spirochaetaceae bacterium]